QRRDYKPLIPAVAALTEQCHTVVSAKGAPFSTAWNGATAELKTMYAAPNIEAILTLVRKKLEAAGPADRLLGLAPTQLKEFESSIQQAIASAVSPKDTSIPSSLPHDGFSSWAKNAARQKPIEVFTTNYDLLFETSFERLRLPAFDGFVGLIHPFFRADFVERDDQLPSSSVVRFWKIHGSINWDIS